MHREALATLSSCRSHRGGASQQRPHTLGPQGDRARTSQPWLGQPRLDQPWLRPTLAEPASVGPTLVGPVLAESTLAVSTLVGPTLVSAARVVPTLVGGAGGHSGGSPHTRSTQGAQGELRSSSSTLGRGPSLDAKGTEAQHQGRVAALCQHWSLAVRVGRTPDPCGLLLDADAATRDGTSN